MKASQEQEYVEYVTARLPALRRVAIRLAGDAHRGDDLVQQAITKLYVNWRRARQADNLDAYAHRILVRVFLDEQRLSWAKVRLFAAVPDSPDPEFAGVDDRRVLCDALARVPKGQRVVLVLRFIADRSVEEVAEILRLSPGTVKSQTANGLATLRRLLAEQPLAITGTEQ